ncbi:MAG TPA: hypothetical protein VIT92_12775, partial [Burkholderiaceae bacterium]
MVKGLYILAGALLCVLLAPMARADAPPKQQTVLVLSADSLGYPNLSEFYGGFRATIQKGVKLPVRLYTEGMDLALFNSPAYRLRIAAWYREKYRDVKPDAILLMGHPALQFVIETGLWAGVPTYFALASENAVKNLPLPANITGQTVRVNLSDTVALARRLFPGTTKLVLVGNRPERDSYRPFYAAELQSLEEVIDFVDLRGMRYEEVAARVAALPDDAVIYHTTFNDDGTGRVLEPLVVLELLTRAANRPTMVDIGLGVGLGPVGGTVFLPVAQGKQAGQKILHLLAGADPATMPVDSSVFPPVFDWRQLQRWNVADARLPPDSELRFYQPTVWQQYKVQIVGALLIIASLTALSIALLIERRRRAIAVAQSRKRLAEIAHMNRNATASVYSAAIAHELNQPLAAILSNAEAAENYLAEEAPDLAQVREILADIVAEDERAGE